MKSSRVIFCVLLFFDFLLKISRSEKENEDEEEANKSLLPSFPVLLRVSARLATLLPSVVLGLVGIFIFVLLSKKALLISLAALYFVLKGKFKQDKQKEVFVYGHDHHREQEVFSEYPPHGDHPYYESSFNHHDPYKWGSN